MGSASILLTPFRFAAANPSSGGHVADIAATSVRMIPESFRGRAETSAQAHPLPKKKIARFSLFD
jgi:hypothetical protein